MLSSAAIDANVFGITVFDPLVEQCAKAFQNHLLHADLELEARLCLFQGMNNERIQFPQLSAGYMGLSNNTRKKTETSLHEFHYNSIKGYLNARVHQYNVNRQGPPITYSTSHTVDSLYKTNTFSTRVSRDKATNALKACICKDKLQSVDILYNEGPYDLRITLATEKEVPLPDESSLRPQHVREKKRSSYFCGIWRIDLTEIINGNGAGRNDYEIEVEIAQEFIKDVHIATKEYQAGKQTQLLKILKALMNVVATLTKATCKEFQSPLLQTPPTMVQKRPAETQTTR